MPTSSEKPGTACELNTASVVEALLFTGGPPHTAQQLAEILKGVDANQVTEAVAQLNQLYHRQVRPYEIRRAGQGYQMALRPSFIGVVQRVHGRAREVRLSLAAVEVLSLVAYRQPVTILEIDAARGLESAAILRQLRRRNLVEPLDQVGGEGRSGQYQTTRRFLELFHLACLNDLPRVQELEKG